MPAMSFAGRDDLGNLPETGVDFGLAQPAMAIEGACAAISMEWDLRGDPMALWNIVPDLADDRVVVGLGPGLLSNLHADVPGMIAFESLAKGRYTMPATPHALWLLVLGDTYGNAFEIAENLAARVAAHARLTESNALFSYRGGRDLSGYKDGAANPAGVSARDAALIPGGPLQGGSFAMVQRWLHFRERLADEPARDQVIGRFMDSGEELPDAAITAHVRRTDQQEFDPPAFMLRRSMPWGDVARHGLQFIAFMNDLRKARRMLRRMIGLEDGFQDALLGFSQAETGAYYYVPPVRNGKLLMPQMNPPATAGVEAAPAGVEIAETASLRLFVDSGKCIHSRNCVLSRPDAFVPNVKGTWLHPELASTDEIVEIAHQCPSGAIQYQRMDGGPSEKPPLGNAIRLRENGPLTVHGDFVVAGVAHMRAALCRCGQSKNKPYCDGSHHAIGFVASGEPQAVEEIGLSSKGGRVSVNPVPDGPYSVSGTTELVSGTGRTISLAPGPTLCRCGASDNKPFCDGSHARVGFKAR